MTEEDEFLLVSSINARVVRWFACRSPYITMTVGDDGAAVLLAHPKDFQTLRLLKFWSTGGRISMYWCFSEGPDHYPYHGNDNRPLANFELTDPEVFTKAQDAIAGVIYKYLILLREMQAGGTGLPAKYKGSHYGRDAYSPSRIPWMVRDTLRIYGALVTERIWDD